MGICSNQMCRQQRDSGKSRCRACNSLLIDTLIGSRYLIKEMAGRGGFGATYLVHDDDGSRYILKELRPSLDNENEAVRSRRETAERLFKREAHTLMSLSHSGIPRLVSFFFQDSFSYLVEEYIPGRTLAQQLEENGNCFSEKEARALLQEIGEILRYLHNQQFPIIHRDIKPQNLMRHNDGRLLLIDFGAVCHAASQIGDIQTLIGSPGYTPPEQIMGMAVPQSDLYAAGATMVHLLTGLHPIHLINKRTQRIEWESKAAVSRQFRDLINELLLRDPHQRLGSANELLRWLKEISKVPPVELNLPSTFTDTSKIDIDTKPDGVPTSRNELPKGLQLQLKSPLETSVVPLIKQARPEAETRLEDLPLPALLYRCYQLQLTGILSCTNLGLIKTLYLEQGAIVFATSCNSNERLGAFLLRRGRISAAQLTQATRYVNETGQRMGAVLIHLGMITPQELAPLIVDHVSSIVYSIFTWTDATFKFQSCVPPLESVRLPQSPLEIIFNGVRHIGDTHLIRDQLGDFERPLKVSMETQQIEKIITLSPREAFVVSRLDTTITLNDLLALNSLPEDEVLRTVYGLMSIGVITATERAPWQVPALATAAPSLPAPMIEAHETFCPAIFCYEVESKLHSLDESNAYGTLEIAREASESEIRSAYERLINKFDPDLQPRYFSDYPLLRDNLEKITTAVRAAYEQLQSPEKRRDYDTATRKHVKRLTVKAR